MISKQITEQIAARFFFSFIILFLVVFGLTLAGLWFMPEEVTFGQGAAYFLGVAAGVVISVGALIVAVSSAGAWFESHRELMISAARRLEE